jgi:hypothetical protein
MLEVPLIGWRARLRDGELIGTIDIYGEEDVHPAV